MPFALIVGAVVTVVVFYLLTESVVRQVKAKRDEDSPGPAKDPKRLLKTLEGDLAELKQALARQNDAHAKDVARLKERIQNLEAIVSSKAWDEMNPPT